MTCVVPEHATLARLWSKDWEFRHSVHPDAITEPDSHSRVLTLSWDHPAAEWLVHSQPPGAALTIDRAGGRWSGVLTKWEIRRVGECAQCAHCMGKVVVSEWRDRPW